MRMWFYFSYTTIEFNFTYILCEPVDDITYTDFTTNSRVFWKNYTFWGKMFQVLATTFRDKLVGHPWVLVTFYSCNVFPKETVRRKNSF